MTWDSTSLCILYLLIRTSMTFSEKCFFFWSCVKVYLMDSLYSRFNLCSSVQV